MKILITGATGLIGRELVKELFIAGYFLVVLTRNKEKAKKILPFPIEFLEWKDILTNSLSVQGVIHLMGENIGKKRWSKKQKNKIYDSRVQATKKLVQILQQKNQKLDFFFSASAIGYYKASSREQNEASPSGTGFLASLCCAWEKEAKKAIAKRIVIFRLGMVLGRQGGALETLLSIFRLGLGGKIGWGKSPQNTWISWIALEDVIRFLQQAIIDKNYQGVFNLTSPHPVNNAEWTRMLSQTLKMPNIFSITRWKIKILLGEMAQLVLDSKKIIPQKLQEKKFSFHYPKCKDALAQSCNLILGKQKIPQQSHHFFSSYQYLPLNITKVFSFFSDANNLSKITPSFLDFKILSTNTNTVQKGTEIEYRLKIHKIPVRWKTLILEYKKNNYFEDLQLKGPYKTWYHQHFFHSIKRGKEEGVLLEDRVFYRLPLEPFSLTFLPWIRNDIRKIFSFRKTAIQKIFSNI